MTNDPNHTTSSKSWLRIDVWLLCILFALSCIACNQSTDQKSDPDNDERLSTTLLREKTSIKFEETGYDFGEVMEGEKVEHTFNFKNSGEKDLLIASSFGSCGCTVSEYPKELIPPGEESKISVIFNSKGRAGKQVKKVFVVANTEPNKTVLVFTANVIEN